jgi:hypothetical protein
MKRSLSFLLWIRRTLGVAMILGVVIVNSQKPVALTASAALVDEGPMSAATNSRASPESPVGYSRVSENTRTPAA